MQKTIDGIASKQKKRIDNTIDKLAITYCSISPILYNMQFIPTNSIPTLAVDENGRGIFNPDFVEGLDFYELKFVLMHEASHVILKHIQRFKNEEAIDELPYYMDDDLANRFHIFNIAADAYINDNISRSKEFKALNGLIYFKQIEDQLGIKYEEFSKSCTEEIYRMLLEKQEEQKKNPSNPNGDSNSDENSQDSSNNGSPLYGDISNRSKIDKEYRKQNSSDFKESKRKASKVRDLVDKIVGNGDELQQLEQLFSNANVNWEQILDKFIYNISGRGVEHKTWHRPNRYYKDVYPMSKGKLKNKSKDVLVSIDISGSMDAEKIAKVISIIEKMNKKYSVGLRYSLFNTTFTGSKELVSVDSLKKEIYKNCGGDTRINAALLGGQINEAGIILISDMEFDVKESRIKDIIEGTNKEYFLIGIDKENGDNDLLNNIKNCVGEERMFIVA